MTPAQARTFIVRQLGVQYAQRIPIYSLPDGENVPAGIASRP